VITYHHFLPCGAAKNGCESQMRWTDQIEGLDVGRLLREGWWLEEGPDEGVWMCPLPHETEGKTFVNELRALINKYSLESGSNTPDYILASFLENVLVDWNHATLARDRHNGVDPRPKYDPAKDAENQARLADPESLLQ